jgi:hypothetical protein
MVDAEPSTPNRHPDQQAKIHDPPPDSHKPPGSKSPARRGERDGSDMSDGEGLRKEIRRMMRETVARWTAGLLRGDGSGRMEHGQHGRPRMNADRDEDKWCQVPSSMGPDDRCLAVAERRDPLPCPRNSAAISVSQCAILFCSPEMTGQEKWNTAGHGKTRTIPEPRCSVPWCGEHRPRQPRMGLNTNRSALDFLSSSTIRLSTPS